MKGLLLCCALSLTTLLGGCYSPQADMQAYMQDYLYSEAFRQTYIEGHIETFRAAEPWMTDVQLRDHAQASFIEAQRSLIDYNRTGRLVEPQPVPLPPGPAETVPVVAAPAPPVSATPAPPVPAAQVVQQAPAPVPSPALQGLTAGQFQIEGGSYRVQVSQEGQELVVHEPNRVTRYELDKDDLYTSYHPGYDRTYYIDVLDQNQLKIGFFGSGRSDILRRVDGASGANPHQAISEKYLALAGDDPANAQTWAYCAAVASERALKSPEQFEPFAREAAKQLQLIYVGKGNPCPDAIPSQLW